MGMELQISLYPLNHLEKDLHLQCRDNQLSQDLLSLRDQVDQDLYSRDLDHLDCQ